MELNTLPWFALSSIGTTSSIRALGSVNGMGTPRASTRSMCSELGCGFGLRPVTHSTVYEIWIMFETGGFVATVPSHLPLMMRWTTSKHSGEYGLRKGSEETIQIIYDSIKGFLHPVITARHILVTARLNSRNYGKSLSFLVILQYVAHSTADGLYEGHERFIPFEIHGK